MVGRRRKDFNYTLLGVIWLLAITTFVILHSTIKVEYEFLSPVGEAQAIENYKLEVKKAQTCEDVDCWVDQYAHQYAKSDAEVNRIKVMLHFLLYKESGYGSNLNCGDNFKACGPLQYWEATYISIRDEMMEKGLVQVMGDRHDMRNAIETTAYALSEGRDNLWGPLNRGELKI